jgi:hypothetical protein
MQNRRYLEPNRRREVAIARKWDELQGLRGLKSVAGCARIAWLVLVRLTQGVWHALADPNREQRIDIGGACRRVDI